MKAFIGLGNVGDKYLATRHNVGFMLLDKLVQELGLTFEEKSELKCFLAKNSNIFVKPTTMMNASGESVQRVVNFYKVSLDDLYIVHDDLDMKLGEYKIDFAKGPKLHNGVNSIEEQLGADFFRVRIGVDNREPENRTPGEAYVLEKFSESELLPLQKVLDKCVSDLKAKL